MHGAPRECDRDHRGLEQEEAAVLRLPEVAELGQTHDARYAPARTITATRAIASRANPTKAVRRSEGARGQTRKARVATPPTQIDAATRCSQSASSESADEFGSVAWCPESERPDARRTETASAGQRSSSRSKNPARRAGAPPRPRSRRSSRGTRCRSASSPRTVGDRRTGDPRSAAGGRSTRGARTPAIPTSITRNAATTETRWKRRSSGSGTRPRRITSRTTSGPMSRASALKSAHRAMSSRHVVPEAPTASVGGGAATPTPNVKTPAGECPSSPITRHRTV